jgi:phage gp29-like protein
MLSLVKYILFKDNCLGNWSEWAEVFGMDIRVGKTSAEGDARNKFLNAIKMMGSAGYGVIDSEDELNFLGTPRTDAYQVYDKLIQYIDTQISKRIFGQDVVTNNTGRIVGTVGENVSNLYGTSDAKFVARVINDHCLEKFTNLKIGAFKGMRFEWDVSEKLSLVDNAAVDLQISQMGFNIDPEYIEEKYGTVLADEPVKQEPNMNPAEVQKKIKQLYEQL